MHIVEKAVIGVVCIVIVAGVVLSRIDETSFETHYVEEDGPIETGTVPALLLESCVCLWRAVRLRGRKPTVFLAVTAILGLMFLFGAGEEISWGKRFLGFDTPAWFDTHNAQHDTTIHNLRFGGMKINKLVFSQLLGAAIIGYVLALPLLYRWRPEVVRICSAFAIPVPRTRHMLVIGAIVLLICGAVSSSKRGELTEFGLSWMMVLCVMFPRNAADFQVAPPRAGAGGIP